MAPTPNTIGWIRFTLDMFWSLSRFTTAIPEIRNSKPVCARGSGFSWRHSLDPTALQGITATRRGPLTSNALRRAFKPSSIYAVSIPKASSWLPLSRTGRLPICRIRRATFTIVVTHHGWSTRRRHCTGGKRRCFAPWRDSISNSGVKRGRREEESPNHC